MDIDAVKSSYARWAPFYDRTFGAITQVGRRATVGYINSQPVESVLEVGVGTGLALQFYRRDIKLTGIDFSTDMLKKARVRVSQEGLTHVQQLLQMDARSLDFPDNHFDVVTAMHIVSVVPEPERVVAEMARVCKPGGKIVITNHFASDKGILGIVEKLSAPFSELLGWHSDFCISTVLGNPALKVLERKSLPPMGVMTFLVLEKTAPIVS
ncbi:class I SAM-dependent methyltransferase [Puniceibacterium sediminis]|uniref:Phosphatidylethanolamine N-methyltransferase /phosphatidyl-N-methylethanolamine N-methyltransferase n=1 Tax=Puniceibacterium sediminis TaxID=1608407 RepID=A0A238XF71_9RHOB|nr:methyltransferase domain-containing protein [Puniceibacterium sediminis]SNR56589.1 phosphatidylethanolamine N-methyltransferase /phosphatidyl-N-methylethanolamine N-methyltransferase [Puniceibacterium sediminis]